MSLVAEVDVPTGRKNRCFTDVQLVQVTSSAALTIPTQSPPDKN